MAEDKAALAAELRAEAARPSEHLRGGFGSRVRRANDLMGRAAAALVGPPRQPKPRRDVPEGQADMFGSAANGD